MSSYFRRLSSRLKRYFTKLGHSLTHPKEPKRYDFKGMKTIHKCSNCSLEYEGNFCPRCGQKASTSRLTPKNLLGGTLEVWDFNNKSVLEALAADDSGNLALLGGQNPYSMLAAGAEKVDMSNISDYDQGCNEEFQTAMKGYFEGSYATYDDALAAFNTAITEKYPELTTD